VTLPLKSDVHPAPFVTQDTPLWWFGGQTPPSTFTLGAIQATFTANGATQGTFAWAFSVGSDKASFANGQSSITVTNGNTVTVVSKASSMGPNDVSMTLTYTPPGGAAALNPVTYSFAVDAPFSLQPFNDPILGTEILPTKTLPSGDEQKPLPRLPILSEPRSKRA
jgi:hypothetical protein